MATRESRFDIAVGGQTIFGTVVTPESMVPGVMLVHGWRGNQEQYLTRARAIAALGCVCLTFDMRGHGRSSVPYESVTREHSLRDIIAAYDALAGHHGVDKSAIAVIGSSYGGYLAAILTTLRPVRWLGLRVPALYRDEDWDLPKHQLDKQQIAAYRRSRVSSSDNRALRACAGYEGDVLVVESENDDIVPHPVIASYLGAFERTRSLTYRVIAGADHALSTDSTQQAYTTLLINWATEMIIGKRGEPSAARPNIQITASAREPSAKSTQDRTGDRRTG